MSFNSGKSLKTRLKRRLSSKSVSRRS